MEKWERSYRRGRDIPANPSFSSSLLDAIYRSIDEDTTNTHLDGGGAKRVQLDSGGPHLVRKHHYFYGGDHKSNDRCFAAAVAVEKKKTTTTTTVSEKVLLRRKAAAPETEHENHHHHRRQHQHQRDRLFNSTSSSSESSYGGFSSSEAESVVHLTRPKPVRTGPLPAPEGKPKSKQESSIRSRFRASKIYGDLKKAKTPVSPGARLASFINNLFAASGNPKKAKISTTAAAAAAAAVMAPSATATTRGGEDSTCSSASSYSRSCLSKTPSSRGKGNGNGNGNGVKRSVTFYPVSIIVDEDCRPCGQKCISEEDYRRKNLARPPRPPPLTAVRMRETPYVTEERKTALGLRTEDDDDVASCDSADLFELENLTAIGGGERYRDELPVYETTFLDTNRAIAQGIIIV